jgi:hypothetical protein
VIGLHAPRRQFVHGYAVSPVTSILTMPGYVISTSTIWWFPCSAPAAPRQFLQLLVSLPVSLPVSPPRQQFLHGYVGGLWYW